jgi:elongation factor P
MADTSDIRNGLCIEYKNDIYSVVEFLHVKPGKGNAFVRTKLKSLTSGKVIDNTFQGGHKIDVVRIERKQYQYLYKDDFGFHFMDNTTYEQISLSTELLDKPEFLKEGMEIDVLFHAKNNVALTVEMPSSVVLEVTYTEPGVRGDTATNVTKPAKLETGAEVKVPIFINEGDKVKIDTQTGAYLERSK